MPEVVKFVRQLAHDLRNDLNAAELQSAYLIEIAEAGEVKDEIKRLRGMISQVGANLQSVTVALGQPRLTEMSYSASDFIEDLRQKVQTDVSGAERARELGCPDRRGRIADRPAIACCPRSSNCSPTHSGMARETVRSP